LAANDAARGSTLEETQLTSPLHRFIYSMPYFHCFICCIYGTVRIYGLHSIEKDISDYLMSRGAVREEITYAILDCVTKGLVAQVFHAVSIIRLTTYLYKARKKDQKLKRKTEEFMRFVFHEIRVPFNSLILSLSVVKDAVEPLLRLRSSEADSGDKSNTDNDNILEHLEIAQISSQGMMRVVNDVLTLQKMQAGLVIIRPEPTDLIHVVRNVIRIHSYEAQKKDIDIVFETSEKLSTMLLVDGKRMHQIISNLVSNAVKFAEKRIVICLDVMGKGSEGGKGTVVLKVKDDGVGFRKKTKRCFSNNLARSGQKSNKIWGVTGWVFGSVDNWHNFSKVRSLFSPWERGKVRLFGSSFPLHFQLNNKFWIPSRRRMMLTRTSSVFGRLKRRRLKRRRKEFNLVLHQRKQSRESPSRNTTL